MSTEIATPSVRNGKRGGVNGNGGHNGESAPDYTPSPRPINKPLLGLLLFLGTEVMFFAGLISTFIILRAGSLTWPPSDQPRLPVKVTAINTLFLLISSYTMFRAVKVIRDKGYSRTLIKWLVATAVLGTVFLTIQGSEWIRLVSYGLTFTSSVYGATFYTLIGCHGLHVLGALIFLLYVLLKAIRRKYSLQEHTGVVLCGVYWYFVVGIWPVLYVLVYLS